MNGHEMDALTAAYVADALSDAERETYEEHLRTCPVCPAEVAELRETLALFAELDPVEPPDSVRDGVLAGIAKVRPLPPLTPEPAAETAATEETAGTAETETAQPTDDSVESTPDNVTPLRGRRTRRWLAAAVAVAAVVVGGVAVDQWIDGDQPQQTISVADQVRKAPDAETHQLSLGKGEKDGSVSLVRSAEQDSAVLVTDNMPEPPEGKTYELWLQSAEGEMVPAGLMDAGGDQEQALDGDAAGSVGAGITVEPDGGSPQPTTDPVALFEFEKS